MSSIGFFLDILTIGAEDETIAVKRLIAKIMAIYLSPNRAKWTEMFIISTIYELTNEQPSTAKRFDSMPLMTAIIKLSLRKVYKISFPSAPNARNTPTLCFLLVMLVLMQLYSIKMENTKNAKAAYKNKSATLRIIVSLVRMILRTELLYQLRVCLFGF